MTDKRIIFKCDVNCIRKNTEECFELDCIKGQESILQQLKAKEQECEKLKNWVKNMMFDTDRNDWFEHFAECFENWKEDLFKQLDQLKKENEELKYKAEFFENYNNAHIDKITKLEKTLTEIKELCQKHIKAEKIVMANDILQKISEVTNENSK